MCCGRQHLLAQRWSCSLLSGHWHLSGFLIWDPESSFPGDKSQEGDREGAKAREAHGR